MATPQVKDLVLRSPAGSSEVITFPWPLQIGSGQDRHDNGIDIIDTIKFVCDELPSISSAFEEINLNKIDTACYKTMTNLVDRFNKAVDSLVALEKGTSLPTERLNKFAHPSLLRHILQLVYNAAVLDPDKLNIYEPFSPEVYGETSYELVQQIIKNVNVTSDDMFIDLGSGVGQVVLQMAGSFPLKSCIGIEKNETPALYAERMDIFFRQFMAWFGKRYCEYKLIRGDFLIDEHREKITSSSLVFVNNFAFGPNLDHQLKERFADLKDGARVVSSKSFCPLNFRITDRNLSDIGTIMHVSEIPPLVGSVSWTCKPVSYYLHVIDRTKLERYFQRLKTQKGADNDNHVGGSTRTTRDRAKREANNQALNHSNNSNSSSSNLTANRPISLTTHINGNATSKTRQQQQHQQQLVQPQNSLDMDTSTESDNGNSNGSGGPAVCKSWSDWDSSKGKTSQSDEEENNNFITRTTAGTNAARAGRTVTQKKRKKLARKVAIANKSAAAAAQREADAKQRADSLLVNNKNHHLSREDIMGGNSTGGGGTSSAAGLRGRKGRMKKGARGRKSIKIVGLDVLHNETILSTSVEAMSKKKPAAPGTVDQQLTSLLTENMAHTELDIPAAPQDTPYALQILLDVFRSQYMAMIDQMKSKSCVPAIKRQIQLEQERKQRIKNRASQLDKQIKVLIDDSVALLKVRMNELGINVSSPNDLIAKAKEIVGRHKELQGIAKKIQSQVSTCEMEQRKLLNRHLHHLPDYQRLCGVGINGKIKLANDLELSEAVAHEMVLKEIANTLAQRKKLKDQVSSIETETSVLEKAAEEKRTAAVLMAQGTNITLANNTILNNHHHHLHHHHQSSSLLTTAVTPTTNLTQPLQLKANNSTSSSFNTTVNAASKQAVSPTTTTSALMPNNVPAVPASKTAGGSSHSKTGRRSRDHRSRSQEWPDVPEMGKIEESNPEILAQKILETGRKIEAGKYNSNKQQQPNIQINNNHHHPQHNNHNHHLLERVDEKSLYRVHHHQQQPPQQSPNSLRHAYHHRLNSSEHQASPVGINYVNNEDASSLMPAPGGKHRESEGSLGHSQGQSNGPPHRSINVLHAKQPSITTKCDLPSGARKGATATAALNIQESPKVANFEDRLKSIITSALNEDQEHRKAQQQMHPLHVEINVPTTPQQSPVSKRSKHSAGGGVPQMGSGHISTATVSNNNNNSLTNIISVATHGITHLNATTTISPITPPLPPSSSTHVNNGNTGAGSATGAMYGSGGNKYAADKNMMSQQAAAAANLNAAATSSINTPIKSGKYYQHAVANNNNIKAYPSGGHSAELNALHRRRTSVSAASYEHFMAVQQHQQQEQQKHHQQSATLSNHHHLHHNQQLNMSSGGSNMMVSNQQHLHQAATSGSHHMSMEFKAPSTSSNPESQHLTQQQRSGSRELLLEEPVRTSSANSDSAHNYYPSTRERLITMERSSSRDSTQGGAQGLLQPLVHQPPSRPSSNSSQPDYTQVSPAKMALRRHLSQEKLNQQLPPGSNGGSGPPISTKTIGDLVNGEIERTLEEGIKLQSIINAAVNMSTLGNAAGERNPHMMENNLFASERDRLDRERAERLIINPNVQRPERVHVRVVDDHHQHQAAPIDNSPRSSTSATATATERKSPYAHNLATLAHVAYQHKNIGPTADSTAQPHQRHYNNASRERTVSANSNEPAYHHLPAMVGKVNGTSDNTANINATARDYQPVVLPRAEMKPCIEAYFQEKQQQNHISNNQHVNHTNKTHMASSGGVGGGSKERPHHVGNSRTNRLNGNNPPLEGLAASLQDRMMASRKFKEEHEERQRRAAAAQAGIVSNTATTLPISEHNHQPVRGSSNNSVGGEHYGSRNYGTPSQSSNASIKNHNNSDTTTPCMKVEHGVKRTSPMANVNHQMRPAKMAHYSHDPTTHNGNIYANTNGPALNHQPHHHHQQQQQQQQQLSGNHRHNINMAEPMLMSPDMNTVMAGNEQHHHTMHPIANSRHSVSHQGDNNIQQPLYGHLTHHHNARHHHQHQQQHQHHHHTNHLPLKTQPQHLSVSVSAGTAASLTSIQSPLTGVSSCAANTSSLVTASRAADDDDVIADDETHWQHRVSSGFDRLVAFASTELDKTRRSIDADTIPSSISCNTSPDSGITHSSSNSEASRTFLSTSSTSSQLDLPISSGSSTSSSGNSSFLSHHPVGSTDPLSDSSMKSENASLPITLKACSSPIDTTAIESPPLSDMGLPRTPSPSSSLAAVATPTPPPPQPPSSNHSQTDKSVHGQMSGNNLKIPLKYQRKSKSSSEKHYKKKFCERNWEYDCDEIMAYSNSSSNVATNANGTASANGSKAATNHVERSKQSIDTTASLTQQQQQGTHHKSSKFRPKGKDWDWSLDSNCSGNNNNNNSKNSNNVISQKSTSSNKTISNS